MQEQRTRTIPDGLRDLREHLETSHRAVDLPAGVVRYDDPFATDF
jgi:hypothetical protein